VDRSDPTGLLDTSATIWNRLAYMEGGSRLSFGEFDKLQQSMNDMTSNQLQTQLVGSKDRTSAIVTTNGGAPYISDPAEEKKTPRGGDPTGAFGYSDAREQLTLGKYDKVVRLIHAHTREGREAAMPTKLDDTAVEKQRAPMYFTSRYLVRHKETPDKQHSSANEIILRPGGTRQYILNPHLLLPETLREY